MASKLNDIWFIYQEIVLQNDVLKGVKETGDIARNLRYDRTQVDLCGKLIFNFKGNFTPHDHFCRFHGRGT